MYEDGTSEDVTEKATWVSSDEDIATTKPEDAAVPGPTEQLI